MKKEMVTIERVCPKQGKVTTKLLERGVETTDLGIRTMVAYFELDGCKNIRVYINGVDRTDEFRPSLEEREYMRMSHMRQKMMIGINSQPRKYGMTFVSGKDTKVIPLPLARK